ncbi:MAG TPA: hemolysin family protein [Acidimicrobiia bacterium]|jgi:CBS domain containing-hemolysin-like protein
MGPQMIPALIIAAFLLLVAGFARAGAASLVRTPRADALHDAAEHVPGARRVAEMLEERQVIVPSINIVHSILLVGAALPAAWALTASMEGPMLLLSLVVLGFILVSFGDLIPRAIGRRSPRRLAYRLALLLSVFISVGSQAAEIMSDDDDGDQYEIGDGDAEDQGEIELITSVLEFSETIVREVMVPRTDMTSVQADASLTELLRIIDEFGFSRIPVVGDSLDDVVGMIIVKDLLPRLASGDRPAKVRNVMRSIDFVPETKRVSDLLRDMQASKSHMAVVVDEYGGTAGLVTIEDLLEELVGEIVDEYDEDELLLEQTSADRWRVDGRLSVSDLSEAVNVELPEEEWDTVGGLVLGLAGRVPVEKERFELGDLILTVERLQGRRISEITVQRLVGAEEAS